MRSKKGNRVKKTLLWVLSIILINIVILLILAQVQAVQTSIVKKYAQTLSRQTDFSITIEKVDIDWLNKIIITGLNIKDNKQHDLLTVDSLHIDYKLSNLFTDETNIDLAFAQNLMLNLHVDDDTLNITRLLKQLNLAKKSGKRIKPVFNLDKVRVADSQFSYSYKTTDVKKGIFNPKNFTFDNINFDISALRIHSDTISLFVQQLAAIETRNNSSLNIQHTDFSISSNEMRFDSLEASINGSIIRDQLVLNYSGYNDLNKFIDSVSLQADFNNAIIYSKDLRLFNSYFNNIQDKYVVSGTFKGTIPNFRTRNLNLRFGDGSRLRGTTYFSGLPDVSETFIDLNLKNSTLYENDIVQYIPSKQFEKYNRFQYVKFNGAFTGYPTDFVAYGRFNTDIGTISSDINFKIADNTTASYSGKMELNNFDLGAYLGSRHMGKTSLNGKLSGNGLKRENASFIFIGEIDSIEVYKYKYTNIETNGKFESEYFYGSININDPSLVFNAEGEIDVRNNANKVAIKGILEHAQLNSLNLTKEAITLRTEIETNFKGFAIDSIVGHLFLENLLANNETHALNIEHLTLSSEKNEGYRNIEFMTERANIKIDGNFNFTTAYKDLKYIGKEYYLYLQNKKDSIDSFYTTFGTYDSLPFDINVKARFSNINQFVQLFEPKLSFHDMADFDLAYKHGKTSTLALQFSNDTISYSGNTFIANEFNLDASKSIGKPEILASFDLQSERQMLKNGAYFENLIASAIWNNKQIDFNVYNNQPKYDATNDIYGEIFLYTDSTLLHLNKSSLSLLNQYWTIHDNNSIVLEGNEIKVNNFNIYSEGRMIFMEGIISPDPDKILAIKANNLDMALFNPVLPKKLSGDLSGEFALYNLYKTPTIVSNFYINSFGINQFLVGDIFSSNDWNHDSKLFDIQFLVNRNDIPVIIVNGIFNPFDAEHALDLDASFMNTDLSMTEPFLETLFNRISGTINGNMKITGAIKAPIISGKGTFEDAGLIVNYLNTDYKFNGEWAFDSSAIYLKNLKLHDSHQNEGYLDGVFTHNNYRQFRIDLSGIMQNFMVLNTRSVHNDWFYGTGYATGTVSFTGPIEDITIKSRAVTEKGTKMYIPIGDSGSSEYEDFISFVNFSDTLYMINQEKDEEVRVTGVNMEFDLDITEDAYGEIIFDINSGDIIRGRGNGNMSMTIDTKGDFRMLGSYEFVEGGYNFTMYNIVNKEFVINPKSKITWSGDPYGGIMDIDASYKLVTDLKPLVDSVYRNMDDLQRFYPTEVKLDLDGPLLTPDIAFNIVIDDYPKSNVDLDTQIRGFLNILQTDQQELNRQVFSLLILRQFSELNSFASSVNIGSSVSEFISNQLSYWISQVDENLTIDMDLGEMDKDALNTFQLRVSYAFMDGKLIVTRDGGFTEPDNEVSIGSIAGDWTLEYLISDDGKLRIKLFSKSNYNQMISETGSDNQSLNTGGFSLIYTTSFDRLSDLFKKGGKKRKKNDEDSESSSTGIKPEEIQYEVPE
ncbi:MAG: translocation/assembly module TamB domain-containing protein [Bacteroidota bacterium]